MSLKTFEQFINETPLKSLSNWSLEVDTGEDYKETLSNAVVYLNVVFEEENDPIDEENAFGAELKLTVDYGSENDDSGGQQYYPLKYTITFVDKKEITLQMTDILNNKAFQEKLTEWLNIEQKIVNNKLTYKSSELVFKKTPTYLKKIFDKYQS